MTDDSGYAATFGGGDDSAPFGTRKSKPGPLSVVNDLGIMTQWLETARGMVTRGAGRCCVAVCNPDPVDGLTIEELISEAANRFAHGLRSYDAIFLHGRDQVLVGLPYIKPTDVPNVLERLKELIVNNPFAMADGAIRQVTVSMGAVMVGVSPVQETVNRADKAMEAGRIGGRNRVCVWTPDIG